MSWRLVAASSQYLTRTTDTASSRMTVMGWVKIVSRPAAAAFWTIANFETGTGEGLRIRLNDAGVLSIIGRVNGATASGSTLTNDTWYHISVDLHAPDGTQSTYRLYLDGVQDAQITDWGMVDAAGNMTQRWGGTNAGAPFGDIKVAYTRMWNSQLNTTEIATERNAATAQKASSIYDNSLIGSIGGWTGSGSPSESSPADNPTLGGGGGGGGRLHRASPLDGMGGAGQQRFNPSLSYHRAPISLEAYRRERAREMRSFMEKVRRAA